ncbi:MAG: RNA methyltransferase [Dissulfurispiraceae bacterium]|jgi:TrmH family RNA methyltransferase
MKNWKDNVIFVLVEPREPGNIGAAARALKNMGFRRLALVDPPAMVDETKWFAHNALDVLESSSIYCNLEDALRDKTIVAGTTRRRGKSRGVIYPLGQGALKLRELATENEMAILFGREDKGLLNEEVEECGFLMSIPASNDHPSLNLAQAVLIVAYELSRAEYRESEEMSQADIKFVRLVHHDKLLTLTERISETLKMLEYIPRGDRDLEKKIMLNLKHFIGRAGLTEWELGMFHGIISQIKKKVDSHDK